MDEMMNKTTNIEESIDKNIEESIEKKNHSDDDVNVLSGNNKIDVDIEPDVKSNDVYLQLCSCSIVFNCFTRNSTAKN